MKERHRGGLGSQQDSHSAGRDHVLSSERHSASSIVKPGQGQPFKAAELYENSFN